jgi:thiamine-phosphate pyrophosphorylase
MGKIPFEFGFYAILTNPVAGYERATAACVKAGVAIVQLRMKDEPPEEIAAVAKTMRSLTKGSNTLFVVNDHPDIAAEVGADGVHIGQGDMSFAEAKAIVGRDAIIGISTHNPDQVKAACALGPDYIGVGPLFPTPTKKIADPAIGIQGMSVMLAAATVPAVVLGSITLDVLPEIYKADARNFSMVRPINQAQDIQKMIVEIQDKWRRCITGP